MGKIVITQEDIIKLQNGNRELFNYIYIKFKELLDNTSAIFPYVPQEAFTIISRNAFMLLYSKIDLEKKYDIAEFIIKNFNKAFKIELRKYASDNLFDLVDSYLKMVSKNRLNSLVEFLNYLKIYDNLDIYIKIINDYKDIESEIAEIVGDRKTISSKELKTLTTNKILGLFIKAFIMKNEILSEEETEFEDYDNDEVDDIEDNSEYVSGNKSLNNQISKMQLLSSQEVISLFEEYHNGSQEAYNKLFHSNLRLVRKIAGRYAAVLDYDDLFQEGSLGLAKAIEKFDPSLGYHFSTYATWWIRQAITRFIGNNKSNIRTPIHLIEFSNKVKKAAENYFAIHGIEATDEELARLVGCTVAKVKRALQLKEMTTSLNGAIGDDESTELGDFVKDENVDLEESAEKSDLKRLVHKLLDEADLNDMQRKVLIYRFGLHDGHERTLDEVGKILGITRERVRQIVVKALNKLRIEDNTSILVDYTDNPIEAMEVLQNAKKGKKRKKQSQKKKEEISRPKKVLPSVQKPVAKAPSQKAVVDFSKLDVGMGILGDKAETEEKKSVKYNSFTVPSINVLAAAEEKKDDNKLNSELEEQEEVTIELHNKQVNINNSEKTEELPLKDKQEIIVGTQRDLLGVKSITEIIDGIKIDDTIEKVIDIGPSKESYGVKEKHIYKYLGAIDKYKYVVIDLLNNIPADDLKLVRIYCGDLFDGVNASPVIDKEKLRFRKQIIPRIKQAYEKLILFPKESEEYKSILINFRTSYNKSSILNSDSLITYLNVSMEKKYILKDLLSQLFVTDLEIIRKSYGDKLDGVNCKEVTNYEKNRLLRLLLPNLREYFSSLFLLDKNSEEYKNKLQEFKNLWKNRRAPSNYIFYYFDVPFNKRYVLLDLINNLAPKDFEILHVNCGNNFDGNSIRDLTANERNRMFQVIFVRLKIYYELMCNVVQGDSYYNELLAKFNKICHESKENQILTNLFTYLNLSIDKKEVLVDAIAIFNSNDQKILKEKCGENYDGVGIKNITDEKRLRLYRIIVPRLKEMIPILVNLQRDSEEYLNKIAEFRVNYNNCQKNKSKSLLDILDVVPEKKKILDELLSLLHPFDLEIIKCAYGNDLNGIDIKELDEFEQKRAKVITSSLQKYYSILMCTEKNRELYQKYIEEFKNMWLIRKVPTNYLFHYLEVPIAKKNVMLDVINCLSIDDYTILENNCGKNFNGNKIRMLSVNERNRLARVIFPSLLKYYKMLEPLEVDCQEYRDILFKFKMEAYNTDNMTLNLFEILGITEDKRSVLDDLLSIFNSFDREILKDCCGEDYKGIPKSNISRYKKGKTIKILIPCLREWLNLVCNFDRDSKEYQEKLEGLKNNDNQMLNMLKHKKTKLYEFFDVPREKEMVLLDILWLLPDEELTIMKAYFGDNFNHEKTKAFMESHKTKFYGIIVPKVQNFYEKLVKLPKDSAEYNSLLEEFAVFFATNKRNTARNLIKYFDNQYSLGELANAVAKIPNKDLQDLIYRACGPKLNGVEGKTLPSSECIKFSHDAIRVLKKVLASEKKEKELIKQSIINNTEQIKENEKMAGKAKEKNLFEYLNIPESDRGIILDLLKCFETDDYEIIKKYFGPNLDGKSREKLSATEQTRFYNKLVDYIKEGYNELLLAKDDIEKYKAVLISLYEKFKKRRRLDNLFEYFDNLYTAEELQFVIKNQLSQNEIDIIYQVCGKNLDGIGNASPSRETRIKLGGTIIPKLANRLKKTYPGRRVEFDTGTLNINNSVAMTKPMVNEETSGVVIASNTTSISKDIIERTPSEVPTTNDNKELLIKDYTFVKNMINSAEFKELLKFRFSAEELVIATLLFYGYQGKEFTINELADFLGVLPENIIDIARRALKAYKAYVASKLDMYEQSLNEQTEQILKKNKEHN